MYLIISLALSCAVIAPTQVHSLETAQSNGSIGLSTWCWCSIICFCLVVALLAAGVRRSAPEHPDVEIGCLRDMFCPCISGGHAVEQDPRQDKTSFSSPRRSRGDRSSSHRHELALFDNTPSTTWHKNHSSLDARLTLLEQQLQASNLTPRSEQDTFSKHLVKKVTCEKCNREITLPDVNPIPQHSLERVTKKISLWDRLACLLIGHDLEKNDIPRDPGSLFPRRNFMWRSGSGREHSRRGGNTIVSESIDTCCKRDNEVIISTALIQPSICSSEVSQEVNEVNLEAQADIQMGEKSEVMCTVELGNLSQIEASSTAVGMSNTEPDHCATAVSSISVLEQVQELDSEKLIQVLSLVHHEPQPLASSPPVAKHGSDVKLLYPTKSNRTLGSEAPSLTMESAESIECMLSEDVLPTTAASKCSLDSGDSQSSINVMKDTSSIKTTLAKLAEASSAKSTATKYSVYSEDSGSQVNLIEDKSSVLTELSLKVSGANLAGNSSTQTSASKCSVDGEDSQSQVNLTKYESGLQISSAKFRDPASKYSVASQDYESQVDQMENRSSLEISSVILDNVSSASSTYLMLSEDSELQVHAADSSLVDVSSSESQLEPPEQHSGHTLRWMVMINHRKPANTADSESKPPEAQDPQ